jgi:hypothetical protein
VDTTSAEAVITVDNAAYGVLAVSTTFASSWFAITSSMPINNLVKPSTQNITIVCNPPVGSPTGMHIETLTLISNDASQATVSYTLACNTLTAIFASNPVPNSRIVVDQYGAALTISNIGAGTLTVTGATPFSSDSWFSINSTLPVAVVSNSTATIDIRCAPPTSMSAAVVYYTETLTLSTSSINDATVQYELLCFSGNSSVAFATASHTHPSSSNVLVSNSGMYNTWVNVSLIDGPDSSSFQVLNLAQVSNVSLAAFSSTTLQLECVPTSDTGEFRALLEVRFDVSSSVMGRDGPLVTSSSRYYQLTCQSVGSVVSVSVASPAASVSGYLYVLTTFEVLVNNSGDSALDLSIQQNNSTQVSDPQAPQVMFAGVPTMIQAREQLLLRLQIIPLYVGQHNATYNLTVHGLVFELTITCTGLPSVTAPSSMADFGDTKIGVPSTISITVYNTAPNWVTFEVGTVVTPGPQRRRALSLSSATGSDALQVMPSLLSVPPNGSGQITATLLLTGAGSGSGQVTLRSPLMRDPVVLLSVQWTGRAAVAQLTPDSGVVFASVPVGSSATRQLLIDNTGNDALSVLSPVLNMQQPAGVDAASIFELTASDNYPWSIAPGTNKAISIRCVPTLAIEYRATMILSVSDPVNSLQSVDLICQGSATCADGYRNQGETDVDCGGPCGPCTTAPVSVPANSTVAAPATTTPALPPPAAVPPPALPTPTVVPNSIPPITEAAGSVATLQQFTQQTTSMSQGQSQISVSLSSGPVVALVIAPSTINSQLLQVAPPNNTLVAEANRNNPGLADTLVVEVTQVVNGIDVVCVMQITDTD